MKQFHKCERMTVEQLHKGDLSHIKYYYDDKKERVIYYCHYCAQEFNVIEKDTPTP